ncbi:MAG TPA: DUF2020 domain-containing protein [Actinophytocola sp.]|nr:DUF2020 domain-containing protein [Actinophytocola sp.]
MRRASLLVGPLVVVLAGCGSGSGERTLEGPEITSITSQGSAGVEVPPVAEPAADGPCPYLDTAFVESTNGQRVGGTKVSAAAEGGTPACFFYRPDGDVQVTVQVYNGEPAAARAFVDRAAPVDTSNPAELDGGWAGGSQPTDEGAVYAVAKEGAAVVVTTNQDQTIKAKLVAEEAIGALGL